MRLICEAPLRWVWALSFWVAGAPLGASRAEAPTPVPGDSVAPRPALAGSAGAPLKATDSAASASEANARALYIAGSAAYQRGQYRLAIEAFEEALRLAGRPAVAFALAQAHRLQYFVDLELAHLERAVALFRRYLDQVAEGGRRDHATQHLSTLVPLLEGRRLADVGGGAADATARPARLIVTSRTPGARARLDAGEPQPLPATFEAPAGPHALTVEAAEHRPQRLDAVGVAGTVVAFNLDLEPEPGRLTLRVPADATVHLDGQTRPHDGGRTALEVAPGRHLLSVFAAGRRPAVQVVTLGRGEALTLEPILERSGQRIASGVLFGAAAALAVGAGVGLGVALGYESEARAQARNFVERGFTVAEAEAYQRLEADRDRAADLALGLGIAAGAAALSAWLLYLFDGPAPAPALASQAPYTRLELGEERSGGPDAHETP